MPHASIAANLAICRSVLPAWQVPGARFGHYALDAGRSDTGDRGFREDIHEVMG